MAKYNTISRKEGDRICGDILELVRRIEIDTRTMPAYSHPQTADSIFVDNYMESQREASARSMYL